MENKTILVALGGNAILRPKQEATFENQLHNINTSCRFFSQTDPGRLPARGDLWQRTAGRQYIAAK